MNIVEQIFYLLIDNPLIALVVLFYVLSAVGNVFTKAAKKAERERRRQQERAQEVQLPSAAKPPQESRTLQPLERETRSPRPAASARPSRGDRSPEEIAAEIRRIMGMGSEPEPVRVEPDPEPILLEPEPQVTQSAPALDSEWSSFAGSEVGRSTLGGGVGSNRPGTGRVGSAPIGSGSVGMGSLGTLGGRLAGARRGRGRVRSENRLVDLSHPAKAIVMMEILGPPRALRESDF